MKVTVKGSDNNRFVGKRLEAIQKNLLSNLSTGGSNQAKGNDREKVINDFLKVTLPQIYRFGSGDITDSSDRISNHCDIVIELPFHLRFSMPNGEQSLYVAESVGVVIEVKTDLKSQWKQVREKVKNIKRLRRYTGASQTVVPSYWVEPSNKIPVYVIAFTGHQTIEVLEKKLGAIKEDERPDGILIIDSGLFIGIKFKTTGVWSMFSFVSEILLHLRTFTSMTNHPHAYCQDEIQDLIDEEINEKMHEEMRKHGYT